MAIMSHLPPPAPFPEFTMDDPMFLDSLPPPSDISLLDSDSSLLSSSETNSIFGFLENFEWEFDPVLPIGLPVFTPSYNHNHNHTLPPPARPESPPQSQPPSNNQNRPQLRQSSKLSSNSSSYHTSPPPPPHHIHIHTHTHNNHNHNLNLNNPARNKTLLSTPQKRLNHIMSEQKRRNAIRDGYATLSNMLAPAGAPAGSGLPTRGRPKGSGSRGKSTGAKGKSGVLFRAVEYCKWLEEGCEALRREVERIELAAEIDGSR